MVLFFNGIVTNVPKGGGMFGKGTVFRECARRTASLGNSWQFFN
jgi:hypothetical protein